MEDLLEDGTDGNVTSIGGEDEGKTRHWEFEVGGVGEGPFVVVEGCSLGRAPVEGLGFPSEGSVERSHGGDDVRQESAVVVAMPTNSCRAFTVVGVGKTRTTATFSCRGGTPLEEI